MPFPPDWEQRQVTFALFSKWGLVGGNLRPGHTAPWFRRRSVTDARSRVSEESAWPPGAPGFDLARRCITARHLWEAAPFARQEIFARPSGIADTDRRRACEGFGPDAGLRGVVQRLSSRAQKLLAAAVAESGKATESTHTPDVGAATGTGLFSRIITSGRHGICSAT